ncbi:hypothetical protein FRC06_000540 [Ceratobasidium sp. 370]|nr:hypothetical protein FRC06_000540 [Ceratobasidium sp. 370]
MWAEHPKWGPDFDQYMEEFEDRFDKAFDNYVSSRETTSIAHDGLLPLSLLETMLTVGDNMHKVDYQHGEKSLTVLMVTIRRYTELNEDGIFEHYYGYLCMRHIMRTVCIGTLIESKVLDAFLNDLDPELGAVEATEALAEVAFDLMTQALLKDDLAQTKKWRQLQEIALRAYLVGTKNERVTMRQLVLHVDMQASKHKLIGNSKTDPEDARTVVRAYANMFRPFWNHDKSIAPTVMLDISNILFQYVSSLLTSELADCIPQVAWSGLERIWLELDRESDGLMAAPRRGFTRRYAADIFHYLGDLQPKLRTEKNERAFFNVLLEIDILGLVGRLLLMISHESRNLDKWDYLRDDLEYLVKAMSGPIRVTDHLAQSNIAEWIKSAETPLFRSNGELDQILSSSEPEPPMERMFKSSVCDRKVVHETGRYEPYMWEMLQSDLLQQAVPTDPLVFAYSAVARGYLRLTFLDRKSVSNPLLQAYINWTLGCTRINSHGEP